MALNACAQQIDTLVANWVEHLGREAMRAELVKAVNRLAWAAPGTAVWGPGDAAVVPGTLRSAEIQAPTVGEAFNLLQYLAFEMRVPLESVVLRVVAAATPSCRATSAG